MIEVATFCDAHRFPIVVSVALQAILTETAIVVIFVAGCASRREPKISSAEFFNFNGGPFSRGDMLRRVALGASQSGVFALKIVASLLVIEVLNVPLDQWKILAIVIGMAACTLLTGSRLDVVGRM